jgi:glycolate oxidase FAD binding subunit
VVHWTDEIARAVGRAGSDWAIVAEAGNGVIRAALASPEHAAVGMLVRLRDGLAAEGGTVVVERAPTELKGDLDPWGPVAPGPFALIERIKREFDPTGILNPGRFVGGL